MSSAARSATTAAIGAAAMYWLDPVSGRRRRARLVQRARSMYSRTARVLDAGLRDLAHRARGLAARFRATPGDRAIPDVVLAERVRSALGRVVSHPGAIDVSVASGRVQLSGAILANECTKLLRTVAAMAGVHEIVDRLAVHEDARGVSALQGGRARQPRFELLQDNWTPAARLLMGAAGIGLLAYGVRARGIAGILSGAAGGTLLLRSTTNMPLRKLAGADGDAVRIYKTLHVNAPVERVFDALAHYENFPYFMRNVRSVRTEADGRSRWRVAGLAGTTVEWTAETTRFQPNTVIAWRTLPDGDVRHSGSIRFLPENGRTRLEIQMAYSPPVGVLGHAVARLFGVDPKKELDEDLLRLKSFLETGTPPRDNAAHVRGPRRASTPPAATTAPEPLGAS